MRAQGQDRFTGQADWKAGRVSSATEEVIAAIERERCKACGVDTRRADVFRCNSSDCQRTNGHLDCGILSNEVNIPHINVITIACIAFACEVCLVVGFYIGWAVGR